MKKIIFFTAIAVLTLSSCRKEATSSEEQMSKIVNSSTANSVRAIPIRYDNDLYFPDGVSMFNTCTHEYINFSGYVHINIRGVINDNKITWIGHYDVHNAKGVGQLTGTRYVTTETFNWSITDKFDTELYETQFRYFLRYITLGKETNFTLENVVHLTVNANGEVTASFDTGGDIIKCQY